MPDQTISVRLEALVDTYQAKMAQARRATTEFGSDALGAAARNEQAFNQLGMAGVAAGGAILAGFGGAASAAIGWESSFAGVRKTVEGTPAELDAINAGLRQMAKELPTSRGELAGIAEAAGQLGIQTPNILGFTRTMADLGETTNLSSDQAATALARLANITGMPQDEFDRLGSTVVALGNNMATTEAEIVELGLRIAGAGRQVGLTEAEILSFAGALSSVGVEAEAGGTALSRTMVEINKAVASGSEELEVFAGVARMSTREFASAWEDDAAGAMVTFINGLGDLDAAGTNIDEILTLVGLDGLRVADVIKRTAGNQELLTDALDLGRAAWAENNALSREAALRYETTEARLKMALNAVTDLAVGLGTALLPIINASVTGIGALADVADRVAGGFDLLPGPIKTAGLGLGIATGAALTLGGALLLMLPRIAATRAAMASLKAAEAAGELGRVGSFASSATTNIGRFARAAGTAGLVLSVATVALDMWNQRKEAAARLSEEFQAALEADTEALGYNSGALDENGLRALAQQLETRGAMGALAEMQTHLNEGETAFDLFAAAVGGSEEAAARFEEVLLGMGAVTDHGDGLLMVSENGRELAGAYYELRGAASSYDEMVAQGIATSARDANGKLVSADAASEAANASDDLSAALGGTAGMFDVAGYSAAAAAGSVINFGSVIRSVNLELWGTQTAGLAVDTAVARVDSAMAAMSGSTGGASRSTHDLTDNTRRLEDAQRAITDAQKDRLDAEQDIIDAQNEQVEAIDRVREAEEALRMVVEGQGAGSDDAKTAGRDVDKAVLAERDATLSLADAEAEVAAARERLAAVSDGVVDPADMLAQRTAALAVAEAEQGVADARTKLVEATSEYGAGSAEAAAAAADQERAEIGLERARLSLTDATAKLGDGSVATAEATADLERAEINLERSRITLTEATERVAETEAKYNEIVDGATEGSEALAEAEADLKDAHDDAARAAEGVTDATDDLAKADRNVTDRIRDLEDAQRKANTQTRGGGGATRDLAAAQRDLDAALLGGVEQIQRAALDMLGLSDETELTRENTRRYIDTLGILTQDLAPDHPLRRRVDELRAALEKRFELDLDTTDFDREMERLRREFDRFRFERTEQNVTVTVGGRPPGRAFGGPTQAGHPYWVGEMGRAELFVPDVDGMILNPTESVRYIQQHTTGATSTYQQTIQVAGTKASPAEIADAVRFAMATSPR